MKELSSKDFKEKVLNSDKPVVVDFWAPWCGPCQLQTPILKKFSEQNNGFVNVGKVNVDNEQELAVQYGIMSIPTLILFNKGMEIKRVIGLQDETALENLVGDLN